MDVRGQIMRNYMIRVINYVNLICVVRFIRIELVLARMLSHFGKAEACITSCFYYEYIEADYCKQSKVDFTISNKSNSFTFGTATFQIIS